MNGKKMDDKLNKNPFVGLFSTPEEAVTFITESSSTAISNHDVSDAERNNFDESNNPLITGNNDNPDDEIIEDVFGILLNSKCAKSTRPLVAVDSETIEEAVFERLTLPNVKEKLVPSYDSTHNSDDIECDAINYLFKCYCRLNEYKNKSELRGTINYLKQLTLQSVATSLEPEILQDQKVHDQYISLFQDSNMLPILVTFTEDIVTTIITENPDDADQIIESAFQPILQITYTKISPTDLLVYSQWWYDILQTFSNIEPLARVLINCSTPKTGNKDSSSYAKTILGALLSISCLPKTFGDNFPFFSQPFNQSMAEQGHIWRALNVQNESLHKIFHSLLKCSSEIRHLTLQWLAKCLQANAIRGTLWSGQMNMGNTSSVVSDGFMLNLGNILLRLCQPFCSNYDTKMPKIDPTYCAAEPKDDNDSRNRGLHMRGINKETCLIPTPEGESRPVGENFSFVTECFYLTHRALDLGYRVVLDKFMKSNQELDRIQRFYEYAQANPNYQVFDIMEERRELEMTKYLSYRTSLLDPELLNLLAKFHATTAFWLVQVNVNNVDTNDYGKSSYCLEEIKTVTFPLSNDVPHTLRCIPEFIVENTVGFICFLKRLNPNTFEEQGPVFLNSILTELILLMESPSRLFNPHLRAQLAEGLEALVPNTDDANNRHQASLGTFHRAQLFINYPHREHIVPSLLQVFVSIEMTGQSVQFEQKFKYRLPMYVTMKYLWKIDEYRKIFQRLATEAENNMEAVQPPLFLRFINLLMNDAVFLLDEALTNMAQLKQMLQAKENGEWDRLPSHEREQQVGILRHTGMIARFDNILGRETISTLKMLTSEIKSIFCHSTMVDRMASMLNYLLLQLVGPNQRNLKVKDQKEYEFNPAQLVLNICEIYINLGQNKNFILAISQDGRSYRPNLFQLADNVLVRIGGINILGDIENLAKEVSTAADLKKEEDEILADTPEEFLDPIMSTLMTDPVILPSSKISVDRHTIARHLLSDQTDPFNRSPLTMDMVKSDTDLRNRIQEWISLKKQSRSPTNNDEK